MTKKWTVLRVTLIRRLLKCTYIFLYIENLNPLKMQFSRKRVETARFLSFRANGVV